MKCICCKKLLWDVRYELSGIWRNELLLTLIFTIINEIPYHVIVGYTNSKVRIVPFCSRKCVDKLYKLVLTNIEFVRLENYYLFNELYFSDKKYDETENIKKKLIITNNNTTWIQNIRQPYSLEYLYRYFNLDQLDLIDTN